VFFWPLPPDPNACITTPRGKVSGLLGADFEFSDTNCGLLLSKDEAITVFASKPGEAEKTAIFKYDPGSSYDDVPTIEAKDQHTVQIRIRSVSSIFFRKDRWKDLAIVYDIGRVDYPNADDVKSDSR